MTLVLLVAAFVDATNLDVVVVNDENLVTAGLQLLLTGERIDVIRSKNSTPSR